MDNSERQSEDKRLGFNEIIPGSHLPGDTGEHTVNIPEFDLNRQMMADHRKLASAKRRGPGGKSTPDDNIACQVEQTGDMAPAYHSFIGNLFTDTNADQQAIIGQIVKRDIERLCRGYTP